MLGDTTIETKSSGVSASGTMGKNSHSENEQSASRKLMDITEVERLQAVNPDIKGWMTALGTNIDYPVLQSSKENPDYYLHRSYNTQYDCNPDTFQTSILYGHHMINRSMFTQITKYNNQNFWREHKTFSYEDVFAVLHVSQDSFRFNRTQFADNADYARFLSALQSNAIYDTDRYCKR